MSDISSPQASAPAGNAPINEQPGNEGQVADELDAAEGAEGQEGEGSAPAPAEVKKEAARQEALRKKFKVKVDGREEEIDLDLNNHEELTKHLQMSKAAQKRMAEMAEYKKSLGQFFEKLQSDPLSVISDPRLKISDEARKKMAEAIINNELEEMQKTPEQREKERLQRELEELKRQHEEDKKTREETEFKRIQEQAAAQYDRDISSAIDKAGLPKTSYTVKQMAETLMFCLDNGLDLSAEDIVPYIKKKTLSDFREMVGSLPDEEFENWLGKDNIGRIRKRNLARLKAATQAAPDASQVKATTASGKKPEEKKNEKISMKDFMSKLGRF